MDKEDYLKELGKKIRAKREAMRMSQTELANRIGKDQPSINRLEQGNVNPSYFYLVEVSIGLEMTVQELLS